MTLTWFSVCLRIYCVAINLTFFYSSCWFGCVVNKSCHGDTLTLHFRGSLRSFNATSPVSHHYNGPEVPHPLWHRALWGLPRLGLGGRGRWGGEGGRGSVGGRGEAVGWGGCRGVRGRVQKCVRMGLGCRLWTGLLQVHFEVPA